MQNEQAQQLYAAADAATKANHISDVRYKEGETSYLEVLDTQRDALAAQRFYTQVQGLRFINTVNLIRALGGGWNAAQPAIAATGTADVVKTPAPVQLQTPEKQ